MNIMTRLLGPEFERNVWTRFSLFSVLLIPVLIGAVMLISYLSFLVHYEGRMALRAVQGTQYLFDSDPHWSKRSLFVFAPFLFLSLYLLGAYEAASAFTSEVRNKTWDMKRVSAISPLHLVVGKLFGVTSYVWYASLLLLTACLYVYAHSFDVTALREAPIGQGVKDYPALRDIALLAVVIIVPAFFAHVVALYGSLLNLKRDKNGSILIMFIALIIAWNVHEQLAYILNIKYYSDMAGYFSKSVGHIAWFGVSFSASSFALLSVAYVISCACLGVYRLVRTELNFKSFPFVYLGFLISVALYFSGFAVDVSGEFDQFKMTRGVISSQMQYLPFFAVFTLASLYAIISVADNIGLYQRFLMSVRIQNWKRALENVPMWLITLPLAFVALVVVCVVTDEFDVRPLYLGMSLLLFIIRDGLVQHLLLLGNATRRAGVKVGVYYLFVYFIVPVLIGYALKLSGSVDGALNTHGQSGHWAHYVFSSFFPSAFERWDVVLLPVCFQIAGLVYLLRRKFRSYNLA